MSLLRGLAKLLVVCLVFATAMGGYLWVHRDNYAADYLQSQLPMPIVVRGADVYRSSAVLHDFHISNPPGSAFSTALAAKRIEINYNAGELFGQPAHIDSVVFNGTLLGLQLLSPNGAEHNWANAMRELAAATGGNKYRINRVVVKDVRFDVLYPQQNTQAQAVPLETVELANLGNPDGITMPQLLYTIVYRILEKAAEDNYELMNVTNMITEPTNSQS